MILDDAASSCQLTKMRKQRRHVGRDMPVSDLQVAPPSSNCVHCSDLPHHNQKAKHTHEALPKRSTLIDGVADIQTAQEAESEWLNEDMARERVAGQQHSVPGGVGPKVICPG